MPAHIITERSLLELLKLLFSLFLQESVQLHRLLVPVLLSCYRFSFNLFFLFLHFQELLDQSVALHLYALNVFVLRLVVLPLYVLYVRF